MINVFVLSLVYEMTGVKSMDSNEMAWFVYSAV